MRVALVCGSPSIDPAVVRALSENEHSLVLVRQGSERLAARWPSNVSVAGGAEAASAVAAADAVIAVDARVALRPSRAAAPGEVVAFDAIVRAAKRIVVIAPADEDAARREIDAARGRNAAWMWIEAEAVFGPAAAADDLVSAMLAAVRALPVVPVLPSWHLSFLPLFAGDLGRLVAAAVATPGAWSRVHRARGAETTTIDELLEMMADMAQRRLRRLPLPAFLAGAGAALAHLLGVELPEPDEDTLARLTRQGASADAGGDGFVTFGVTRTPLDRALRELSSTLPEQPPAAGRGALQHKRFWVDITGSALDAEQLLEVFRCDCADIMPIEFDVEEGSGNVVERGRLLTAALPMRGHIQMRVQETLPRRITFATVEGHPIAGVVRFITGASAGIVTFTVEVYARSGTSFDFVALKVGGSVAQNLTWTAVCERMVERSGGTSAKGVEQEIESLDDEAAHAVEAWVEALIARRERAEHEAEAADARH